MLNDKIKQRITNRMKMKYKELKYRSPNTHSHLPTNEKVSKITIVSTIQKGKEIERQNDTKRASYKSE